MKMFDLMINYRPKLSLLLRCSGLLFDRWLHSNCNVIASFSNTALKCSVQLHITNFKCILKSGRRPNKDEGSEMVCQLKKYRHIYLRSCILTAAIFVCRDLFYVNLINWFLAIAEEDDLDLLSAFIDTFDSDVEEETDRKTATKPSTTSSALDASGSSSCQQSSGSTPLVQNAAVSFIGLVCSFHGIWKPLTLPSYLYAKSDVMSKSHLAFLYYILLLQVWLIFILYV